MIAKVTFNSNNTFNIDFNYYLQDQYIWGSNYNRAGSNARAASEGGLSILCKVGYSAKKGVLQEIEGKDTVDYVEETVTPKEYKMLGIYNDSYKNLSINYRFPAKDPQEKNRIYYYDDNAKLLKTLMLNKSEGLTLETSLTSKEGYKLVGWADVIEGYVYRFANAKTIYPKNDMILTPKYEKLNLVTFKDYDGTILNTQYVERGKSAVAPENPRSKREGYYFRAWDKDFNSIYRDTTITAEYALKKYKVKYYDKDGNMIGDTRIHKHGSDGTGDVKAPEYPGYTFKGWDKDITNITSDMNVKAMYEKNKYSVEFRGYKNGIKDSLIDKQTVEYGNSAIAPTVPNDPAYTFLKWDRDYSIITANTVVNGVYSINEYKVSFVDYDDKLLSMQTVKYGDSASAPKSPVREGYIFKGWDKSFDKVTSSIKVEPVYEKIKNKVVFKDNITGKVIFTQYVSYNENAKVPTIPEVEGYTFVNWQGDYSNVKEPKEIIANYKKKEYSVIFNDINGNIIKEQKVKYLDDAQAPEVPQEEGYDFNGWDNSFENVKGDLVVNAKYSKKKFKVVFKDVEGNVLSNQTVEYGDSAIEPQVELEKGMKFNGWDKSFDFITEDIEISALSEKIMFNVVFKDMHGNIISTQSISYGEDAKEPEIPKEEGYTFVKWNGKFNKIKSNKEIKAIYNVNKYTVTFLDIDGDAMEIHHVTYGNKAPEPLPPEVEGKIFDGWDTDFSSVKTDLVVKPIYKNVEVKDNEEIKVPSGDNDKIEDNNKSDGEHGKTGDNNMANMVLIGVSMIFGLFGMKKFSRNNN